jgi:6-phosphogluconolactonase
MRSQMLYVGTYTQQLDHADGQGEGIYRLKFDAAEGTLTPLDVTEGVRNSSYLTFAPLAGRLYVVEECDLSEAPQVMSFALGPDGELTPLNRQPAQGSAACHVIVDPGERWLFVAHYVSGNIAVYPLEADGRIGPVACVVQHEGSGPNPARQEGPHAHCCALDQRGDYLFVADLGLDRVMVYAFDSETGQLSARAPGIAAPGAGPRHIVVHPNNRFVYVINELDATVTCFAHEGGALTPLQSVSTRPPGAEGTIQPAAIRMTRRGDYLFTSNRIDDDSITLFGVDGESGKLTPLDYTAPLGKNPRDFILDDLNDYLIVANLDSSTLVVFEIDAVEKQLRPTGITAEIPSPAALVLG